MVRILQNLYSLTFISISSMLMFISFNSYAFQQEESLTAFESFDSSDCGQFRTQTQGGWGSNAAGNNPGAYRDLHFEEAFPNGLSIGCNFILTLTSSEAVQEFLPSGGTASKLTEDLVDPIDYSNVLAGQLVALRLSVSFDELDSNFSESDVNLGNMIVSTGEFQGWTVYEIIEEANNFIGACSNNYTASQLNEVLSSINENYVDGTMNGGFLDCPEEETEDLFCSLNLDNVISYCDDENTYIVEITISGTNGSFIVEDLNALTGSGDFVCLGDSSDESAILNHTFFLSYDISSSYSANIYALIPAIDGCFEAINSEECTLGPINGDPPICCDFSITCPDDGQMVFSCIADIPAADTSLISYENNCGPVIIDVSENTQGQGCSTSPYYLTRTYNVSDGTSSFSCVFNFIAFDNLPPVIICPPDEFVECNLDVIIPQEWATATDNCDNDVDISYIDALGGSCDSFIRIWTATDDCGNTSSCDQIVYTTDTTPPNLIIPEEVTVDCLSEILPSITGEATATDLCSNVIITYEDGDWSGDPCFSSLIRTWTATDACGNAVSGQQTINREDNVGPVLTGVPSIEILQCGEFPEPPLVVAYDLCQEDSVEVILTETEYGEGCNRSISRTWTATDSCGNISSATSDIIIKDTQGPEITCPESVLLNCGDQVPDTASAGVATAFDNCSEDEVTITYSDGPLNGDCPPSIHRTWTAVDTCGNATTCIQLISFLDTEAPEMDCLDPVTINCSTGDTSPFFTGTPSVISDCSTVTLDYIDGDYEGDCPVSFIRTWVASDVCGNSSICEQVITVIDEMPPAIFCPDDKTIGCGDSTAPENTGTAGAYDNCLSVSVSYLDSEMSGSCPQSFVRTWTATDYCGNSISCDQTISIEDNTAPVITCPSDISLPCDAADFSENVTGTPDVYDACSATSLSHIDMPIEGDCPQFFYRIWKAVDECDNYAYCTQMIYLVDDVAPELTCPEDVTIPCDSNTDPEFTGYGVANDNCSEYVISYLDSLVNNGDGGSSDDCGDYRTQTQGGWGTAANGNNPGTYRDANFDPAFPNGLTIGCNLTLTLTSSLAVENFLPAGGTPSMLLVDMVDPVGYGNTLAGQLTALSLSVGFDNYDPDFSLATTPLSELIIGNGVFAGWTVAMVLIEANKFIGQCESSYSASELNQVLSSINENFVDGTTDNGFLLCDEETENCFSIYRTWTAVDACGNESSCIQLISASNNPEIPNRQIDDADNPLSAYPSPTLNKVKISSLYSMDEGDIIELYDLAGFSLMKYTIINQGDQLIDLSSFDSGIYILQWTGKSGSSSIRIVKN